MALVSIIIPCYNQAKYLGESVGCILKQTYIHWEAIIVNDGSTDNTETIALEWTRIDARIKYIKNNGGLSDARNVGVKSSKGEYIVCLDADDKISNLYIEKCIQEHLNEPDLKISFTKLQRFGNSSDTWGYKEYKFNFKTFLLKNQIYCSAMYKRADYDKTQGYRKKNNLEDWEFWIQLLSDDCKVSYIDEIHFYYRDSSNSMSRTVSHENYDKDLIEIFNLNQDKYLKHFNPILSFRNEDAFYIEKKSTIYKLLKIFRLR